MSQLNIDTDDFHLIIGQLTAENYVLRKYAIELQAQHKEIAKPVEPSKAPKK